MASAKLIVANATDLNVSSQPEKSIKAKPSLISIADIGQKEESHTPVHIPAKIVASYTNDYNIIAIHNLIIHKLSAEKASIAHVQDKLNAEKKKITLPQTLIERNASKKEIARLQEKIAETLCGSRYNEYIKRANPLIEEYKALGQYMEKKSFVGETSDAACNDKTTNKNRLDIIKEYLNIARNYHDIDIMHESKSGEFCSYCDFNLKGVFIDESGLQICPKCKGEKYVYTIQLFVENSTIAAPYKPEYESGENFIKALTRYQGKQTNKLPRMLFSELDVYFARIGIPTQEKAKAIPLNGKGRKAGTNLPTMYKALSDLGYSSLYEDTNLICHLYWGWKLPDISHLEEKIISHYHKTEQVYNQIEKTRTSSLGTQYRLFKHLQLVGHECSIDDFKISNMTESREYHDILWKKMVEGCNEPNELYFIPTL